nr:RNA-directed DNA polymerase, eukaryota, reverse transcriptase zinc-binding domain protein [Tanacetum cinerariifolium]
MKLLWIASDPTVSLDKAEPNKLPLWVKPRNLPLEAWSSKGLSAIASRMGTPLIMDEVTTSMCKIRNGRMGFSRVMIDVEAEKGLPKKIEIVYKNKKGVVTGDEFLEMERNEIKKKQDSAEFKQEFKDCVNMIEVKDLCSSGLFFTWTKNLKKAREWNHTGVLKKLDRVMVNEDFMKKYDKAHVVFNPYLVSDHSQAVVVIPSGMKMKKKAFKFANFNGHLFDNVKEYRERLKNIQKKIDTDPYNKDLRDYEVVTLKEYATAMGDNKAPGPDRYSVVFFKILGRKGGPSRVAFKIDIQKAYDTVNWNVKRNPKFQYHYGCKNMEITHVCFADDLLVLCHGDADSVKVVRETIDKFDCNSLHLSWNQFKYIDVLFLLPKAILKEINSLLKGFLWCNGELSRGAKDIDCILKIWYVQTFNSLASNNLESPGCYALLDDTFSGSLKSLWMLVEWFMGVLRRKCSQESMVFGELVNWEVTWEFLRGQAYNCYDDGRVDIQTKNAGYGGNANKNAGRQNRNQVFNQEIEKGPYARECQKLKVRDAKYFKEQMLLAMKDEAGSNLTNEENDFMLDSSYGEDTLEELTVAIMLMARLQPADDNAKNVLSYDAKAVSEHETRLAKKAFKERENRYLEDIIDLEEKQTGLGYQNPKRLKKAIAAQPKLYNRDLLHSANLIIDSPDLKETLEDAKESRLKMRNKMVQINYSKLNALYETFVPQKEFSAEQTYFLIPSTSNNGSESKEVTSELPIFKMSKESRLLNMFGTMGVEINGLQTRIDKTLLEDRERRWMSDS